MPAQAGIQVRFGSGSKTAWIPASAGVTETRVDFQSTNSEPLGLEPRVVQFHSHSSIFPRHSRILLAGIQANS
jgi:hypothetical protein